MILMADLLFLLISLIRHELLIVFYSSGLWLEFHTGFAWVILRMVVVMAAHKLRYPKTLRTLIAIELLAGVMVALTDLWIYFVTDCECSLQIDGAFIRLVLRSSVLAIYLRLLK